MLFLLCYYLLIMLLLTFLLHWNLLSIFQCLFELSWFVLTEQMMCYHLSYYHSSPINNNRFRVLIFIRQIIVHALFIFISTSSSIVASSNETKTKTFLDMKCNNAGAVQEVMKAKKTWKKFSVSLIRPFSITTLINMCPNVR